MRFNDACQEAAVCRETQLASFCKLLDTHVFLVRDDQLRRCHRGQFSLQTRVHCLFSKPQAPHMNVTWRSTRESCPRRLEKSSAKRRAQPRQPEPAPDAGRVETSRNRQNTWIRRTSNLPKTLPIVRTLCVKMHPNSF